MSIPSSPFNYGLLAHAQAVIESWRREYNKERPKKLGRVNARPLRRDTGDRPEYSHRRALNRSATEHGGRRSFNSGRDIPLEQK